MEVANWTLADTTSLPESLKYTWIEAYDKEMIEIEKKNACDAKSRVAIRRRRHIRGKKTGQLNIRALNDYVGPIRATPLYQCLVQ